VLGARRCEREEVEDRCEEAVEGFEPLSARRSSSKEMSLEWSRSHKLKSSSICYIGRSRPRDRIWLQNSTLLTSPSPLVSISRKKSSTLLETCLRAVDTC